MTMDADSVIPASETVLPPATAPRPRLFRTAWGGAKTGFRRTSYVIGPIATIILIPALVPTAIGLGAGRGLDIHKSSLVAIGLYLVTAMWGAIIGAALGGITSRLPETLRSWLSAAAKRPIRLGFRRRRQAAVAAAEAPSKPRRRLWPWLVGVPIVLILGFGFGAGVYLGRVVDRRLAEAVSAADRDDPNWRIDDLMSHRDPVPDEENSALVVAQVLSVLREYWPGGPAPPPGHPNPPQTETEVVLERLTSLADNVRLDEAGADIIRGEHAHFEDAVRIARTVAGYARGRHELELGPTLFDTPLPETQASRGAARLLRADAALRVHDGDADGALDSCRALLGVGRSIGDEPFLISFLVRVSIGTLAAQSARRVLGQGEPSDAALARFQALLLDELSQPLLLHGLKGERAVLDEVIRRIAAGEMPISALSDGPQGSAAEGGRMSSWGKLWFDHQRAVGIEWMNDMVDIGRRPAAERPALVAQWQARLDRVKNDRILRFTAVLPLLLCPGVDAAESAQSRTFAELGATAIVIAAERHRRKTGDWPSSIAAIDPAIMASPPTDPFSGGPYLIERSDGRFVVHSIGPDHKDDRGAYDPKRWMKGGPDDVGAAAWDVPRRGQPPLP
jgi:hypothetical protein